MYLKIPWLFETKDFWRTWWIIFVKKGWNLRPDPALLVSTGSGTMTFRFTPLTGAPSGWSPTIRPLPESTKRLEGMSWRKWLLKGVLSFSKIYKWNLRWKRSLSKSMNDEGWRFLIFGFVSGYTLYRNDGLGGVLRFSYEGDMDGTSTVNLVIGGLVENRQCLGRNADVPCIFRFCHGLRIV